MTATAPTTASLTVTASLPITQNVLPQLPQTGGSADDFADRNLGVPLVIMLGLIGFELVRRRLGARV